MPHILRIHPFASLPHLAFVFGLAAGPWLDTALAQDAKAPAFSAAQQRGIDALMTRQEGGQFSYKKGDQVVRDTALTAFGLMALQSKPKSLRNQNETEAIAHGLAALLQQQNEDGSFGTNLANYTTCVAVGALAKAGDPAVAPALAKAQKCILRFQQGEAGGLAKSDRDYGGFSYGGKSQRADLSNVHFALEALRTTGLPASDDAFVRAVVFLQRTQNLRSVNDFAGKVPNPVKGGEPLEFRAGNNGGACYYPGNSNAGYVTLPDGSLEPRSYGSMTYSLLKAYLLAGLPAADARVRAAVGWIQGNWTLTENPGADAALGDKARYQGQFYYYLVLAQALDAHGEAVLEVKKPDGSTAKVDWRQDLRKQLESLQRADGTWINDKNDRWMEGVELLCSCFAMLALERCH